ncbi:MAG: site-specific integrase [Pseudomonadota bacterium]
MASINKMGNGWQAQVRLSGQRRFKTFERKSDAKKWATAEEAKIIEGKADDPISRSRIKLSKVIDNYIADVKPVKRWGRTKDASLKMLRRDLGDVTMGKLNDDAVVKFVKKRAADGAGPVTWKMDLTYLGAVLEYGRAEMKLHTPRHLLDDSRRRLKNLGHTGRSQERDRRPAPGEVDAIKAEWRSEVPPEIIDFAIASCMRLGEICRIEWADVDEVKRTVMIRDRKHPTQKIGNDQSVPLLEEAWDILQAQPRVDARVWPFKADSVSAAHTRAAKRAGVDDLRFHDYRHEGISRLFEAGLQIQHVALVSGHKDWKQLKRYTNLKPESLHEIFAHLSA